MNFDLTTKEGWLNASMIMSRPMDWIEYAVTGCLRYAVKAMFSDEDETEKQTKAAKEIIDDCRSKGIKHGKIKVTKDAGAKLAVAGYGEISGRDGNTVEVEFWT